MENAEPVRADSFGTAHQAAARSAAEGLNPRRHGWSGAGFQSRLAACSARAFPTRSRTPFPSYTGTAAPPSASTRNASSRPLCSTATEPLKPLHTVTAAPRRR